MLRSWMSSLLLLLVALPSQAADIQADPAKPCNEAYCQGWNLPQEPFRIFGNSWYVGTRELASILITDPAGLILLDGALPQSVPLIAANIEKLGFRVADIRLIVTSHPHFDHVGGVAALARASGAQVAALPAAAVVLEAGHPLADDPQFGFGIQENSFPKVAKVRRIADGETLRVGELAITAHATPGHAPGGTSWTWRSCDAGRCVDIVYADSLNAVSAKGVRYTDRLGDVVPADQLRTSIAHVAALPCDILLTGHSDRFNMAEKLAARAAGAAENPFIDTKGCRTYAEGASQRLDQRLERERTGK